MYETILFPTDGSDESLRALEHALDVAHAYDATLHALYVVDTGYPYVEAEGGAVDLSPVSAALRTEGERALEQIETRAERAGTAFVGATREASLVHRAITDYAAEHGVDLIVMGTHGRRGFDRWLLGSVTERVIRTADAPVLTVRSETERG
jgi:nucleotide-binding universal stress UspA family protein